VVKPTFEDCTGDFERICRALAREYGLPEILNVDIKTLRKLPGALRDGNYGVTVSIWNEKEVIRVQPGRA